MDLNHGIFLQTHLSDEDNKVYEDAIKYLFGNLSDNYKFININKETDLKNINNLNHIYNEYCTLYYIYENKLYEKYDTVSLGHYRRIPNIYLITENKIKDNNIQYYDHFLFSDGLYINHISDEELKKMRDKYENYWQLCEYHMSIGYPLYVCEDMIEYLKQQTIIDQDKIINKCKRFESIDCKHLFVARSMFTCNKIMFTNMMKFVNGYVNYLGNKYRYNLFDYNGCVDFVNFYLIEYFRKNYAKYIYNIEHLNLKSYQGRYQIFQDLKYYKEIFNPKTNYGLDTYCNNWRFFGYTIEWLINLFIICNYHFLSKSISTFNISKENKISINVFINTPLFNKLTNLHVNDVVDIKSY